PDIDGGVGGEGGGRRGLPPLGARAGGVEGDPLTVGREDGAAGVRLAVFQRAGTGGIAFDEPERGAFALARALGPVSGVGHTPARRGRGGGRVEAVEVVDTQGRARRRGGGGGRGGEGEEEGEGGGPHGGSYRSRSQKMRPFLLPAAGMPSGAMARLSR